MLVLEMTSGGRVSGLKIEPMGEVIFDWNFDFVVINF